MQLLCVFGAVIVVSIIIRGDVSREGVDLALEVVERGDVKIRNRRPTRFERMRPPTTA